MQVEFVPVFDSLTDQAGQLKKEYTTDGLHLSVTGYQVLTKALKDYLFQLVDFPFAFSCQIRYNGFTVFWGRYGFDRHYETYFATRVAT